MAVKLRLKRMGRKRRPFYRIVATDARTARDGKYLQAVGYYDPLPDPAQIVIDEQKALYWLKQGAIPTETVKSLLSKRGILHKWDMLKKGFELAKIEEEMKRWELLQLEKEKRREAAEIQARREAEETEAEMEQEVSESDKPVDSTETTGTANETVKD